MRKKQTLLLMLLMTFCFVAMGSMPTIAAPPVELYTKCWGPVVVDVDNPGPGEPTTRLSCLCEQAETETTPYTVKEVKCEDLTTLDNFDQVSGNSYVCIFQLPPPRPYYCFKIISGDVTIKNGWVRIGGKTIWVP